MSNPLLTLLLAITSAAPPQDARLELPDGPAAKAWAGVGTETVPAELPVEVRALGSDASTPGAWRIWSESLEQVRRNGDPASRAALALFARAQRRATDAWTHLAELGPHPEFVAALGVRLLPGVPDEVQLGKGGMPVALEPGVRLEPLVPPTSGEAPRGQVEWRSATLRGLPVGGSRIDFTVTVEATGVQVDLAHAEGDDATVEVVLPLPESCGIEVEYLDWERLEVPVGGALEATVSATDLEARALYGRTFEERLEVPGGSVNQVPRQLTEGGLLLVLPEEDPDRPRLESIAEVLSGLLDVRVEVVLAGEESGWSGTRVALGIGDEREARLAFLASRTEALMLQAPPTAEGPGRSDTMPDEVEPAPFTGGAKASYVFLGDSITHEGHYLSALYAYLISTRGMRAPRLENAGVTGGTVADALERVNAEVLAREPDGVILQLGTHDAGTAPHSEERLEAFVADLGRLLDRIEQGCEAPVVLLGPPLYVPADARRAGLEELPELERTLEHYRAATREIAGERGHRYVDLAGPMRELLAGLEAEGVGLTRDGLQPDEAGALAIAWTLAPLFGATPPLRLSLEGSGAGEQALGASRLPVPVLERAAPVARLLDLESTWNRIELDPPTAGTDEWRIEVEGRPWLAGSAGEAEPPSRIGPGDPLQSRALEVLTLIEQMRREEVAFVRDQVADLALVTDRAQRMELRGGMRRKLRLTWVKLDAWDERLRDLAENLSVNVRLLHD